MFWTRGNFFPPKRFLLCRHGKQGTPACYLISLDLNFLSLFFCFLKMRGVIPTPLCSVDVVKIKYESWTLQTHKSNIPVIENKKGRIVRNTAVLLQLLFPSPFNHLWPFLFPNQRTVFIDFTKIYILCLDDSMEDQMARTCPHLHPPPQALILLEEAREKTTIAGNMDIATRELSYRRTPVEVFPADPRCLISIFLEKWYGHSYWDKQDLDGMGKMTWNAMMGN